MFHYSDLDRERCIVTSMSVSLHVCPQAYHRNHTSQLLQIFYAFCLWSWMDRLPPATSYYVMYLRFCGWCYIFNNEPHGTGDTWRTVTGDSLGATRDRGLSMIYTVALIVIVERTGISATVGWTGMNGAWREITSATTAGLSWYATSFSCRRRSRAMRCISPIALYTKVDSRCDKLNRRRSIVNNSLRVDVPWRNFSWDKFLYFWI